MSQELDEANTLWVAMQKHIKYNFSKPDEEGYVFLANQHSGKSAPFEFARRYGFTIPIFKIKKAYNANNEILEGHEAWWVKNNVVGKEKK